MNFFQFLQMYFNLQKMLSEYRIDHLYGDNHIILWSDGNVEILGGNFYDEVLRDRFTYYHSRQEISDARVLIPLRLLDAIETAEKYKNKTFGDWKFGGKLRNRRPEKQIGLPGIQELTYFIARGLEDNSLRGEGSLGPDSYTFNTELFDCEVSIEVKKKSK